MKIENILNDNIGELELVDAMGNDLSVVNAARISYGGGSDVYGPGDKKLINYLAANRHTSPFRHAFLSFRILAPEFVLRQWYKHVIGCSWITPEFYNHGWNEISGRYKEVEPRFYLPPIFKSQSSNSKQASGDPLNEQSECYAEMVHATSTAVKAYETLIGLGVSKEQARLVLPISFYTEVIWTASLQSLAHFCSLRDHEHAQEEIREYAKALSIICKERFPDSWEALTKEDN